jgi:hypothetical protein
MTSIYQSVESLSNIVRGYFGEFIVESYYSFIKCEIKSIHRNNIDFLINWMAYDIKSSFTRYINLNSPVDGVYPIHKREFKEIGIIYVILYKDCVVISQDGVLIHKYSIQEAAEIFSDWEKSKGSITKKIKTTNEDKKFIDEKMEKLKNVCKNKGRIPIIRRRNGIKNQTIWSKGPMHLLPNSLKYDKLFGNIEWKKYGRDEYREKYKYDMTLCIWTEGNNSIHKIIAFDCTDIDNLLKKETYGKNTEYFTCKLNDFPVENTFDSIEDFEKRFKF